MSDAHDTHLSSLPAEVEAQAQAEAERFFGNSPVAAWRPASASAKPSPWVRRALCFVGAGCLAVGALVVMGGEWARDHNALPASPIAGDPADDIVDEPLNVPLPMRVVDAAPPTPSPATLNITRRGAEWRIEAVGVSRLVAAQRLAQVSGSPLLGDIAALAAARPIDLHWQGRGAANAWQAVLGPGLSFATQCGAVRCRVWILDAGTSEPSAGPGPVAMPPIAPMPSVPSAPATVEVAAAPSQSDSADAQVAAHHD